jgi:DNA-binding NarL/FixJ family response regulator/two-component sensor histidine kinase
MLYRSQNPLADDDAWEVCAAQARSIISECARALAGEDAVVRTPATDPQDVGAHRARQAIHPIHSVRAGRILVGLVLRTLGQAVRDEEADAVWIIRCMTALEDAVWERMEVSFTGYDSYLLTEVRTVGSASRRAPAGQAHDRLDDRLSAALRQVEVCAALADQAPHRLRAELSRARETLSETLDSVRQMATGLRQSATCSLESTISSFVQAMEFDEPAVHVEVSGDETWASPTALEDLLLIVRECLRNSLQHARARTLAVSIDIAPLEIRGHVEDDGLGFDVEEVLANGEANGLVSLMERAELLGGRLLINSTPGSGTRTSFSFPNRIASAAPDERDPIRVMLADDHTLLRSAIGKILSSAEGVSVVAETGSGRNLVELAERHRPHVLLLDVDVPDCHAPDVIARLRELLPDLRVLILSMNDDPHLIQELIGLGAHGYLHKGVGNLSLVSAIQDAVAHPTLVTVAVPSESLSLFPPSEQPASGSGLSPREIELITRVASGLTNRQIAHRLGITEGTVKRHLRNIFKKLDVTSRIEAVNRAAEQGLLSPPSAATQRASRSRQPDHLGRVTET